MRPIWHSGAERRDSSSGNHRDTIDYKGRKPSCVRRFASRVGRIFCSAFSNKDSHRAEAKVQTAEFEGATRRAQWMCGDLIDVLHLTQKQEEATRNSRQKLEETLEQYHFRQEMLALEFPGQKMKPMRLRSSCAKPVRSLKSYTFNWTRR
jgi:hypothetical protein